MGRGAMIPVIRLSQRVVTEAYDALKLLEVHLLFPGDSPPGGLVRFLQVDGDRARGERTVVLEAKDFDAGALNAVLVFVAEALAARNEIAPHGAIELIQSPPPPPAPVPPPLVPRLG